MPTLKDQHQPKTNKKSCTKNLHIDFEDVRHLSIRLHIFNGSSTNKNLNLYCFCTWNPNKTRFDVLKISSQLLTSIKCFFFLFFVCVCVWCLILSLSFTNLNGIWHFYLESCCGSFKWLHTSHQWWVYINVSLDSILASQFVCIPIYCQRKSHKYWVSSESSSYFILC